MNLVSDQRIMSKHRVLGLLIIFLLVMAVVHVTATWYVMHERQVYTYDSVVYWWQAISLGEGLANNPVETLKRVWLEARIEDYPSLTVLPLVLTAPFGSSRLWYILSIINIFAIPSIVLFAFLLRRLSKYLIVETSVPLNDPLSVYRLCAFIATLATIALDASFLKAIVGGMPDVGGTAIIFLVFILTLPHLMTLSSMRWKDETVVGILLFCLVRFRRWYLFWVAGYFAARVIMIFLTSLNQNNLRISARQLAGLAVSVGVFALLLFVLTTPFAYKIFSSNYQQSYSAFRLYGDSYLLAILLLLRRLGYLPLLLSFCGFIVLFLSPKLRLPSIFLAFHLIISLLLFLQTQGLGTHHLYLITPTLLIFSGIFWIQVIQRSRAPIAWCTGAIIGLFCVTVLTFSPAFASQKNMLGPVLPTAYYPITRNDIEVMQQLYSTLTLLSRSADDTIYVLSSNELLGDASLRYFSISFPLFPSIEDRILHTRDIDMRDGFPTELFTARYVVVANPPQTAMGLASSQIITEPVRLIFQQEGFGRAYKRLSGEYLLDKNVRAYIYERTRNATRTEIQEFSGYLRGKYPDHPFVYTPTIPERFLTDI